MGFICTECGYENVERDNIYGTICVNCKKYIPPATKPKFVKDMENKIIKNQEIVRQYLRQKILGDKSGNKI